MIGTASKHLLCEYWGCDAALLNDGVGLERELRAAARAAGATVVSAAFHRLSPHGVSGVVLLEESHFCIHTWPERAYAAADFFTCGACAPERGQELLQRALGAVAVEVMVLARGQGPDKPGIDVVTHTRSPLPAPRGA
jgi:S-adenosylmethionine decarboxylase proenzyme